jgi:glycosyltransferase involved in cell wall biosynthesis
MKGISVIICCYNSAGRIVDTLQHLLNQELSGISFEVVLVDNNCIDDTIEVAKNTWSMAKSNSELKIVTQPMAGLSFAREKGIETAKYNYLVFCDDDNSLDKHFLQTACDIFESDPKVGIIGGKSEFFCNEEVEDWFKPFQPSYACGAQWPESDILNGKRDYVWGAGMCIRKDVINKIHQLGVKSFLSDRKGKELGSGGDTELCYWVSKMGYKIMYSESLQFVHKIDYKRTSWEYLVNMYKGFGKSNAILYLYEYHFFDKYSMIGGFPVRVNKKWWHPFIFYSTLWLALVVAHYKFYNQLKKQIMTDPNLYQKGNASYLGMVYHNAQLRSLISIFFNFYSLNKSLKKYSRMLGGGLIFLVKEIETGL